MTDTTLAMDLSLALTLERDCRTASARVGSDEAAAMDLATRHAIALRRALEKWIGVRAVQTAGRT